jgi:hypothetical protein
MRLWFPISGLCTLALALAAVAAGQPVHPQPPAVLPAVDPAPMPAAKAPAAVNPRGRGHKPAPPEVLAKRHADAFARHGHRVKRLPEVTAAAFDCRTMGWVLPVNDQGQCGDCFGVSTLDAIAAARAKAGVAKNDESGRLSGQYGLDCGGFDGGCDGGDEAQVFEYAKTHGFPLTSDYAPYTARPGRCKTVDPSKLVKIADWGYCTPAQEQGVAATADVKRCMTQYGPISVAFDAGECDNYVWPRTMTGRGRSVDHAVLCIGWDDAHDNGDGTKGAFLGSNQWGGGWGSRGVFWIKYGADSWATEAIWVTAAALPPPPSPPPPGPVPPAPPVPPGPPAPPVPGNNFSGTLTYTYQNGALVGPPVANAPAPAAGVEAELRAAGVSPALILDVLKLVADIKAKAAREVIFADVLQIITDIAAPAEPAPKVGRAESPAWALAA